jgi:hypothetical protein
MSNQTKRCGAVTRTGALCKAAALPKSGRCKNHGGLSTGPKTIEGCKRVADAQRRRWSGLSTKAVDRSSK